MPGLLPNIDPDGLLEYSVVYTDRALNHMSQSFRSVMNDISQLLKSVYAANSTVVIPGTGTVGMEAVARQFAHDKKCLVIRNGWFSYRWSQIFEMGKIPSEEIVLRARMTEDAAQAPFVPAPIDEVVGTIEAEKPDLVFAPHVETSAGMMLPDDYLKAVATAVHSYGGMFVVDSIASGTSWINMEETGVDVLVTAPQKGWSGTPCSGIVMLSARAREAIESTTSSSFACDLKKWLQIMETYEGGGHAYHATMPTDALTTFRNAIAEAQKIGFDQLRDKQNELGRRIREVLTANGFPSVAAEGFQASGVVVSYTSDPDVKTGKKFAEGGIQIAGGVPLQCDERDDFQSFRIGLFGFDKLQNVDRTVDSFEHVVRSFS
ncbi:MAG: aminotransferase class V-fold PLP-dependent enzyme [Planctomycetaceae bacterium]